VIPEGDEAHRSRPPQEGERDTLAERRARRAWLGDAALLRRAEAAEATVRTLEAHLADLRHRQVEAELDRENAAVQLAERDRELRRVKQREYAEQQLRVEAEEATGRVRRGHRAELDRLQQRADEARAAAQHAEEQRAGLAAHLAEVGESCLRLKRNIDALQSAATELRTTFERDQETARARIEELERALASATESARPERSDAEEALRREEMAGALAAAVGRLRARVGAVGELPETGSAEIDRSEIGQQTAEVPMAQRFAPAVGRPPIEVPAVGTPTVGVSAVEVPAVEVSAVDAPVVGVPPVGASAMEVPTVEPVVAPIAESLDLPSPGGQGDPRAQTSTQSAPHVPPAPAGTPEISTVYVVPRLFPASRRHDRSKVGRRLAPAVRRVAGRLVAWADRAQSPK
jgi:hypothetical protein